FCESMPAYMEAIRLAKRSRAAENRKVPWMVFRYGRAYWNASATKRALAKVPGFDEEKFDQDLGIQKVYGRQGPLRVPFNLWTVLPALPVALALNREYRRRLEMARRWKGACIAEAKSFLDRAAQFHHVPAADFWPQVLQALDFQNRAETAYFTTIYNNANAQSDFKAYVARMDAAVGGSTSVIRLIGGLEGVSHLEIQRGLIRLHAVAGTFGMGSPEFARELKTYMGDHAYHADAELDLLCPRWGEDPTLVRAVVERMIATGTAPADPDRASRRQRAEYEAEIQSVEARLKAAPGGTRKFSGGFRRHLKRVREYLFWREEMRDCSTRAYHVVRLHLLEAGRRMAEEGFLRNAEDVFFLDTGELRAIAAGTLSDGGAARLPGDIRHRRLMFAGLRDLIPPNEFGRGVVQKGSEATLSAQADGRPAYQGLGCSPGSYEGPVRVVVNLADSGSLREGEILVTKFTDPGWTPVLGLVKGIVTEVGGLLSHAAVIGREYGIPAVLNLPGATQNLRTGMRVRIEGDTGRVVLLDAEPSGAAVPGLPVELAVELATEPAPTKALSQ
ncbi:MAG TPA: PEP-utilizing enzyme, partial [Bdellovibrionota bacterium]|nr:PEP-utilizing enzyme [Bdellovibrionota bacterium]